MLHCPLSDVEQHSKEEGYDQRLYNDEAYEGVSLIGISAVIREEFRIILTYHNL